MAHISSSCQICHASVSADDVPVHAQAHGGQVHIVIASKSRMRRRPAGRRLSRRAYLSAAGGGLGALAGFLLFGTFLIALACGALAFVGLRRVVGAS